MLRKRTAIGPNFVPVALNAQRERLENVIAEFRKNLKGAIGSLREGVAQTNGDREAARRLVDNLRTGESFDRITAAPVYEAIVAALLAGPDFPIADSRKGIHLAVNDGVHNFNDTLIDFRLLVPMDRSFQ